MLGNSPFFWKSKKQHTVSRSSSKAEYRAVSTAAAEVTWLVRLLQEPGVNNLTPVTLHFDNQSTIHIAKNSIYHERTKHIEVDYHLRATKFLKDLSTSYLFCENFNIHFCGTNITQKILRKVGSTTFLTTLNLEKNITLLWIPHRPQFQKSKSSHLKTFRI